MRKKVALSCSKRRLDDHVKGYRIRKRSGVDVGRDTCLPDRVPLWSPVVSGVRRAQTRTRARRATNGVEWTNDDCRSLASCGLRVTSLVGHANCSGYFGRLHRA